MRSVSDNDMRKGHAGVDPEGKAITNKTFEAAAKSQDMDIDEARKNTLSLLNQVTGEED